MKKKNKNLDRKKILLIAGAVIIVIGIILIIVFLVNNGGSNNSGNGGDVVCTLEASIGDNITVNNEASFMVDSNKVTSSKITSTITTTDFEDETFLTLQDYNTQLLENNTSISDIYRITSSNSSFSIEENITYNKDSDALSVDISQMRANLLIPDYDSNTDLDNIKKEYQDFGYSCK